MLETLSQGKVPCSAPPTPRVQGAGRPLLCAHVQVHGVGGVAGRQEQPLWLRLGALGQLAGAIRRGGTAQRG